MFLNNVAKWLHIVGILPVLLHAVENIRSARCSQQIHLEPLEPEEDAEEQIKMILFPPQRGFLDKMLFYQNYIHTIHCM